ncbi:MAG: chlorite dismutase family protein [Actinomycetota bacterium]|jgi:chlorite dismutase|nr:chlorite dismutase family protein [Actinomycetota bacterium]
MAPPLHVAFAGGATGPWRVDRLEAERGRNLPLVERLSVIEGGDAVPPETAAWVLRGVMSNERYVTRAEHDALAERQQPLGRPESTRAALIPIRKTDQWWDLSQDERRAIFEERSRHVGIGLEYLPAVARRLHHCRELGEPFDFLTWFEYAQTDAKAFEELVARLRETEEWTYVEREIDIRLTWEAEGRQHLHS